MSINGNTDPARNNALRHARFPEDDRAPEPTRMSDAASHPTGMDQQRESSMTAFTPSSPTMPTTGAAAAQGAEAEHHQVHFHDGDGEPPREPPSPASHTPAEDADGGSGAEAYDPVTKQKYSRSFLKKSYVNTLPDHLIPLANQIHQLDEKDLVLIADLADTEATKDVYSLLPYTGSNWFLPSIRECEEDEKHWGFGYSWHEGLLVFIGGRRLNIRVLNILVRVAFLVLCWFMLWNILPHWLVEPGGYVWDPLVLIIVSAIVGGLVCRILQIPPLVGVLWMGIMWNNIPYLHYLTSGIVKEVFDICSKLGLTVILARAGYSLSIKGIRPHWKQSILLATLPFAIEGVAHSLIANKVFEYNDDYNWAFLQGMLCSIVSPAVVVPGTLYLQEMGYGKGVGPLSLMLSAVGVEIVIGVWCANFIIGLIFYDQKLVVAIILGPVQFIGGVLIGIGLGFVYFYVVELIKKEARRLPNGKYEREHFRTSLDFAFAIFLFACFTMVFLGYGVNLAGGGCVMCVFFASTVSHLWLKDGVKELEEQKKYIGSWLAFSWDQAMLPVLFATMGAKIDILAIFNGDFFPKAIICLVASTGVRLVVIFCVQLGSGMPWKEKLLVCVGYLGKASAQASVGPIAANLVANMIAKLPDDQKGSLDVWARNANYVQQMSAMYVMFMAAIASLGLVRGGMVVLTREQAPEKRPRTARRNAPDGDDLVVNEPLADGLSLSQQQQQQQQHTQEEEEEGNQPLEMQARASMPTTATTDDAEYYGYNPDTTGGGTTASTPAAAQVASSSAFGADLDDGQKAEADDYAKKPHHRRFHHHHNPHSSGSNKGSPLRVPEGGYAGREDVSEGSEDAAMEVNSPLTHSSHMRKQK